MSSVAIILAAGKGTRMTSDLPKVLHEIQGRPMVKFVIDAIRPVCTDGVYIVVGYKADEVMKACRQDGVRFVLQREQLGTGHAVRQCEAALGSYDGTVVVLNGDVPCVTSETIRRFRDYHVEQGAAATVLTTEIEDARGYGRIVRGKGDELLGIVEEKDADRETRRIREINSGLFCFDRSKLFDALRNTGRMNAQKEYYLTDVIAVLRREGHPVRAYRVDDAWEVAGVNTDQELEALRGRWAREGPRS